MRRNITCASGLTLPLVLQDLFLEVSAPGFVLLLATFLEQLDRPQKIRDLVRHCLFFCRFRAKHGIGEDNAVCRMIPGGCPNQHATWGV